MKKSFLVGISLLLCTGCAGVSAPVGNLLPLLLIEENTIPSQQKPARKIIPPIALDERQLLDQETLVIPANEISLTSTKDDDINQASAF
jgi:hypothetical protein